MFRVRAICNLWLLLLIAQVVSGQVSDYEVVPAGFNTPYNDFSPFLAGRTLYFISDKPDQMGVYYSSTDSVGRLTSIYQSQVEGDTVFQKPEMLEKQINRLYNSGPCWVNKDQSHIWFSSNEAAPYLLYTGKEKSRLKLFLAEKHREKWGRRTAPSFQRENANYTHPFLTVSEDTLYFASDMPGGQGGYDLYYTVKQDGNWSEPVNLGNKINSSQNDVFPVLHGEKLFFSSSREGGHGMLDIYETILTESEPVNLPAPFNSAADDFAPAFIRDGSGYFSSSRNGNDDIYYFRQLFPTLNNCREYERDKFCFTFFEESEDLDDTLALEYQWDFGDGTTASGKEARHCFKGYGEYLVELNIVDRSTNALFFNEATYPFSIEPSERLHLEGPDTVPPGVLISFYAGRSFLPSYTIDNYFWELDSPAKRQSGGDTFETVFQTEGTHILKMGVKAFSDESGLEEVFCVMKTIEVKNGAVYDPPSEIPLIIDLTDDPTDKDTVTYTLFLAVSDTLIPGLVLNAGDTIDVRPAGEDHFLYSIGDVQEKGELLNKFRDAQETGFTDSRVAEVINGVIRNETEFSETEIKDMETTLQGQIMNEQVITSFELFYETDVAVLKPAQQAQLKRFVQRNPLKMNQRILISSFTDSKGNDAYNLDLSKRRSEAVKAILLQNSYQEKQIEIEYFGTRVPAEMQSLEDAKRRKSLIIIYEIN